MYITLCSKCRSRNTFAPALQATGAESALEDDCGLEGEAGHKSAAPEAADGEPTVLKAKGKKDDNVHPGTVFECCPEI